MQQHLTGVFTLPSQSPAPNPQPPNGLNPWLLGLSRVLLFWLPAVLLATLVLWLTFPGDVGRGTIALMLAVLGAPHDIGTLV
jgi:hypothetical protein